LVEDEKSGSASSEARGRRRLGQETMAMTTEGNNRIMIFGPKEDGTYVVEFEVMAISIPRTETAVIRHFQERMPYGLFVPEPP